MMHCKVHYNFILMLKRVIIMIMMFKKIIMWCVILFPITIILIIGHNVHRAIVIRMNHAQDIALTINIIVNYVQ